MHVLKTSKLSTNRSLKRKGSGTPSDVVKKEKEHPLNVSLLNKSRIFLVFLYDSVCIYVNNVCVYIYILEVLDDQMFVHARKTSDATYPSALAVPIPRTIK